MRLSERIRATLNWVKALLLVAGRLILLNEMSMLPHTIVSRSTDERHYPTLEDRAVRPSNESEDAILIWAPFVECLYENYEI